MKTHGPLNIEGVVVPMFQENSYLLWPEGEQDAWIVDPGFPPSAERLVNAINKHNLTPRAIVLTHCHLDHIAGNQELRDEYPDLPIWAPEGEEHMLIDPAENLSAPFGLDVISPPAERTLKPRDALKLGSLSFYAIDVRGHSPAGLAFYCPAAHVVLTGDSLFAMSIGRMDFPGGSRELLVGNIRKNLLTLPDDTAVYSGHGPPTTIKRERNSNPALVEGLWE